MTKIPEVHLNYNHPEVQVPKHPNFGHVQDEVKELAKITARQLEDEIKRDYFSQNGKTGIERAKGYVNSKVNAMSHFLEENSGEIQNQMLNGAFTATLAPLVILKNPLLQKNEDDKKYAALRQPVSAALAMSTGLGMTIGINKGMNKLFDSGLLATNDGSLPISLDGRMQPSEDFVKAQLKAELSEISKGKSGQDAKAAAKAHLQSNYKLERPAQPNILDKAFTGFNSEKATLRAEQRGHFKAYKKALHSKREDLFTRLFGDEPGAIKFDETTKGLFRIDEKGKRVDYGKVAGFESQSDVAKYVEKHNLHKKTFAQLMLDKYGFETYTDGPYKGQIKPSSKNKLAQIKAKDFLRDIGLVGEDMKFKFIDAKGKTQILKFNDQNLNLILNVLSEEKTAKGLDAILKDPEMSKKLAQIEGKSNSRAIRMAVGADNLDKMSVEDIFRRIGILTHDVATGENELSTMLNQTMNSVSEKIATRMKIFISEEGTKDLKVKALHAAKNITKNAISNLKEFKTFSNYAGIFFNLGTTAVGCTLLNALYPPFVALVAPDLAKDKKDTPQNGGSK